MNQIFYIISSSGRIFIKQITFTSTSVIKLLLIENKKKLEIYILARPQNII